MSDRRQVEDRLRRLKVEGSSASSLARSPAPDSSTRKAGGLCVERGDVSRARATHQLPTGVRPPALTPPKHCVIRSPTGPDKVASMPTSASILPHSRIAIAETFRGFPRKVFTNRGGCTEEGKDAILSSGTRSIAAVDGGLLPARGALARASSGAKRIGLCSGLQRTDLDWANFWKNHSTNGSVS